MADVKQKVEHALNEGRILILGAEVLLGFQYRSVFEQGFERLPTPAQYTKVIGLGLLLVAIALLMWPPTYHQLVEEGKPSARLQRFISKVMAFALLPFAAALGIDFYVAFGRQFDQGWAIGVGLAGLAVALFFWYGLEVVARSRKGPAGNKELAMKRQEEQSQEASIAEKIKNVLTETRMVLPGAQALLGFQFAAMLMENFEKLPTASKYVHLGSLALIGVSTVLLMTPAAYHRIVENGEDTEGFHRFASLVLMAAMVFLAAGVVGDLYVVVDKVMGSRILAIGSSVFFLTLFLGLWFGYSFYRRSQRGKEEIVRRVTSTSEPEVEQRDAA